MLSDDAIECLAIDIAAKLADLRDAPFDDRVDAVAIMIKKRLEKP
jgi:hypothetical protein